MKARLRTALLLAAPALLLLLCGMPALFRTGQADPLGWAMAALILIPASAALSLWRGGAHALWAGAGALTGVLTFVWIVAGRAPDAGAALALAAIMLVAVASGSLLPRRPAWGIAIGLLAAAAIWWSGREEVRPVAGPKPRLAVISGLPLFWREGQGGMDARADAPIVSVLRTRFDVNPLDSALSQGMARADTLLLAQPRGLAGAELAAIDTWVRKGGHAVVLADPLLRWPSVLPLGDRRRAPAVSLLTTLLTHWDARLLPPESLEEERRFLAQGQLLTIAAASGFEIRGPSCRTEEEGLIATCALGRGRATLIADADVIDDRLWLADPSKPLQPRQWTADTPGLLTGWLGGEALARPRGWLRSEAELRAAIRWAALAGIFWAGLGSVLLDRRGRGGIASSRGKSSEEKG